MKWLYAKILSGLAFISALLLWRRDRRLRKEAEKDIERLESNAARYARRAEVAKEVQKEYFKKKREEAKKHDERHDEVEELKDEKSDRATVDIIKRLLNNKDRD